MQQKFYFWVEKYLFNPSAIQKILAYLLLPLTGLYCLIVLLKRKFSKPIDFQLPIISVGNLIVGGAGKTPVTIALAENKKDVFIILRGYKRASKGLIMISDKGKILTDVKISGDEAMLLATALPHASIIVSENRILGIEEAKRKGAKIIFLDDGFSKANIQKLDLLIKPDIPQSNNFCLPSGPYREPKSYYHDYLSIEEDRDFFKSVEIENPSDTMLLITAISKPQRLEKYLPKEIEKVYFPDHYAYKKEELEALLKRYQATSILTTTKDAVKMQTFNLPLSILRLKIRLHQEVVEVVDTFIEDYAKISQK